LTKNAVTSTPNQIGDFPKLEKRRRDINKRSRRVRTSGTLRCSSDVVRGIGTEMLTVANDGSTLHGVADVVFEPPLRPSSIWPVNDPSSRTKSLDGEGIVITRAGDVGTLLIRINGSSLVNVNW
jgi:hypothetical protein